VNTSFDPTNHIYKIDGYIVPSVSKIANPDVEAWYTEEDAQRGTFVHLACELYDRGTLCEATLDPQLKPYLNAWKTYRKFNPEGFALIEEQLYSADHGFAGTVDRCYFDCVLDIKTGTTFPKWLDVQLGGYSILTRMELGRGVLLMPNGKFRVQNFGMNQMAQARGKFLAALGKVNDAKTVR
jgi:hypothetical protein